MPSQLFSEFIQRTFGVLTEKGGVNLGHLPNNACMATHRKPSISKPSRGDGSEIRAWVDFADPWGAQNPVCAAFGRPRQVLQAHSLCEVRAVLQAVQEQADAGFWCVGYVTYEAAPAFDAAFQVHHGEGPLAWFAVYDQPLSQQSHPAGADVQADWQPGMGRGDFDEAFHAIQSAIAAGDVYQLNFTAPLPGRLRQGTAWDVFQALRQAQPGGYGAYIDTGEQQVLSVSPELFFAWDGEHLLMRPMKGTAPRGATPQDDAALAQALRASPKEQAENVMIVDLIRNDVSRLAQPFSVAVPRLFELRALPTVWQMTSDVTARTRSGVSLVDVFAALFPCGSVTGAPKVQAMRLIREREAGPRGVYCGAIGVVRPGGAALFNVAIRTVTARGDALTCGIGSGITAGSHSEGEWQEWRHKRAFLERARAPFDLLETLALDAGVLRHLDLHLARLTRASRHFGYRCDEASVLACLQDVQSQHPTGLWRVRLLLSAQGQSQAQAQAMTPTPLPVKLVLAHAPFEMADSEFVRFKTTRRDHYDQAASLQAEGVFDTLLWNVRGELTECTRGNMALCLDGEWWTPPLSCGLLDGVGRAVALHEGRVREAVLRREDVFRASGLAYLNSLRGWLPAQLVT